MVSNGTTDYGVRLVLEDGSFEPANTEEIEWVSLEVAKKIAAKLYDARATVVNSPVVEIQIIDASYNLVQNARF